MRSEREKSNLKRKVILESDTEEEAEGSERKEEDVYTEEETKNSEYNTVKILTFLARLLNMELVTVLLHR